MILKDFQVTTVKKILEVFEHRNRYLVADEVGLGKTIVARGVIEGLKAKKAGSDFRVIYICSNMSLANQNIKKLKLDCMKDSNFERLVYMAAGEEESGARISALTPDTSFRMKKSNGTAYERSIIFKLLREIKELKPYEDQLKDFLKGNCGDSWENEKTSEEYLSTINLRPGIQKEFQDRMANGGTELLIKHLNGESDLSKAKMIVKLRRLITDIVLDTQFKADLFILDEFQRFSDLIDYDEDDPNEFQMSAKKIFGGDNKILMLSATPFKSYSVFEDHLQNEDHFSSLKKVLNFLFNEKKDHVLELEKKNNLYFECLNAYLSDTQETNAEIKSIKKDIEKFYMEGIARTERCIAEDKSMINNCSTATLTPAALEIGAYCNIGHADSRLKHFAIEFCKSSPYPMSFARDYSLHKDIFRNSKTSPDLTLLKYKEINTYSLKVDKQLHGKIGTLVEDTLDSGGDKLLWIPPSIPYYRTNQSINHTGYSKTLVFSSWSFVPKAISVLLSYEQEKRVFTQERQKKKKKKKHRRTTYFAEDKKRLSAILRKDHETTEYLTFASQFLADNIAISFSNQNLTELKTAVEQELRTYSTTNDEDRILKSILNKKIPTDVASLIAIGSPAVCALRSLKKYFVANSTELITSTNKIAEGFISYFNKHEIVGTIQKNYPQSVPYWHKCLLYCCDHNLQSMLDEFMYMIKENKSYVIDKENPDMMSAVVNRIFKSLTLMTTNNLVDLYDDNQKEKISKNMRRHFAVAYGTQKDKDGNISTKEALQDAFNSPFRPFVLTTTSIGQEGLDFHFYCRNIYHWNIPSNPIDIEQREGRVNRYQNHALRLNIAMKYTNSINRKDNSDLWSKMFTCASNDNHEYCDLVPNWHLNIDDESHFKINRKSPIYSFSKDHKKYKGLLKSLLTYRLTLGQPNQELMLESINSKFAPDDEENIRTITKDLAICLAPIVGGKNA